MSKISSPPTTSSSLDLHTKIVATLGPASDSPETIRELITHGVRVFRFNMKHADTAWHAERIPLVREAAKELGIHVGCLIDLQGPEIRIETPKGAPITLIKGDHILFALEIDEEHTFGEQQVRVPHPEFFEALQAGDHFTIDDGFLDFVVTAKQEHAYMVEAVDDCVIKHRKGLNIVGKDIALPSLAENDMPKLDLAALAHVEYVALSFSRTRKDIEELRAELKKREISPAIVAKVESQAGLDNIDEIIEASDVIMVARGDLGIETPIERLAFWQKTMIAKCRLAHKPVITATQMLDSMVEHPLPTRAEATDVANAVFDGTDAIMLSAESASGKYPVKTVQTMAKIARFNETAFPISEVEFAPITSTEIITSAVQALILASQDQPIQAIVAFTDSGYTARVMSSLRLNTPIIAITEREDIANALALSYGVYPVVMPFPDGLFTDAEPQLRALTEKGMIHSGDRLLIIHGKNWRSSGFTNSLSLLSWE